MSEDENMINSKENDTCDHLLTSKENVALTRAVSFLLAIIFSVIILLNPHFISSTSEGIKHGLLSFQMLAICAAFVHGIGFKAENIYFRIFLSPFFHWPVLLSLLN